MDVSLGGWWFGGRIEGCVFRWVFGWVDVWMDVSVGGWGLGGCMDGCVCNLEVVGWMHGWICV